MAESIAYLDGRYVPISEARLHVFDMGIVQGASISEVLRTFHRRPFRLEAHLDRLQQSLQGVGFAVDLSRSDFESVLLKVVEENARPIPPTHDLGITAFVTAGLNLSYTGTAGREQDRGPTVCVHTFPLPFELWASKYTAGQHLVTPDVRQIPPETLDPRIKSRSRLHWYIADRQARQVDPQAGALVLDQRGFLAETSAANFFIVESNRILTPRLETTLGGISRQVVAELAAGLGVEFRYEDLPVERALAADEAFTSSTPYCLLPVTRINRRPIGGGEPGPVFRRLIQAWNTLVGLDIIVQAQTGASDRLQSQSAETR